MATRNRPSVTQYWGDSASSILAEGGGIIRIGYDQATFEKAVNEVIVAPEDLSKGFKPLVKAEEGEEGAEEKKEEGEKEEVAVVEEKKEEEAPKKKVELSKEDVALIVKEFEVTTKEAEAALRKVEGDLSQALRQLTAPVIPKQFKTVAPGHVGGRILSVGGL
ncbi:hypothetical protein MNV49_007982 [Pseudohyphozyma bogoriensis]|nr:hypothetical protein MNV49_007982 [Pseudohyphozyma bogoriensis]